MAIEIKAPFEVFHDGKGNALEGGYIYIGQSGQSPQAYPKQVYWDAKFTQVAVQPIRTVAGRPSRNGAPSKIFSNGDFSMTVRDADGALVYSELVNEVGDVKTFDDGAGFFNSAAVLPEGTIVEVAETGLRYIAAAPGATDHHVTNAGGGKFYVLPLHGVYHVEAWGDVTSTSFNKAVQDVVAIVKPMAEDPADPGAANFQHSPFFTLKCTSNFAADSTVNIYDAANLFGVKEILNLHLDLRSCRATASGLNAWDFVFEIWARNGEIWTPSVDCADISSGIFWNRCITATIYGNNIIERIADGGVGHAFSAKIDATAIETGDYCIIHKVGTTDYTAIGAPSNTVGVEFQATGAATGDGIVFVHDADGDRGETDNTDVYGLQTYEGKANDVVSTRQGIGVLVNTYDFTIYGYRGGWCEIPIYFGPGAKEVTMQTIHPFNGIPGGIAPTDPIALYFSEWCGDVYIRGSYADNGLAIDKSGGRAKFSHGHYLELGSAVILNSPYVRVYCNQAKNGSQPETVIDGMEGLSVGFYDSDGTLSKGGATDTYNWGGDLTGFNTPAVWAAQESKAVRTSVEPRAMRAFLRDNSDINNEIEQETIVTNGRHIVAYRASRSDEGASFVHRNVADPDNGEYRTEFTRDVTFHLKNFAAWTEADVTGGTLVVTDTLHELTATGGTENLFNATGGQAGDLLIIRPVSGKTIVVKHDDATNGATGKFYMGGSDRVLAVETQPLFFIHGGTNWLLANNTSNAGEQYAFASRALLVAAVANGVVWVDGSIVSDGKVQYVATGGATAISDLPGLLPFSPPSPMHWGAVGDAVADDAVAVQSFLDYVCNDATLLQIGPIAGDFAVSQTVRINSATQSSPFRKNVWGLALTAHSAMTPDDYLLELNAGNLQIKNMRLTCNRVANGVHIPSGISGLHIDGGQISKPLSYGVNKAAGASGVDNRIVGLRITEDPSGFTRAAHGIYWFGADTLISGCIFQYMARSLYVRYGGVAVEHCHFYQGSGGGVETAAMPEGVVLEGRNIRFTDNYMDKCFLHLVNGLEDAADPLRDGIAIQNNLFYTNTNFSGAEKFIRINDKGNTTSWEDIEISGNRFCNANGATSTISAILGNTVGASTAKRFRVHSNNGNVSLKETRGRALITVAAGTLSTTARVVPLDSVFGQFDWVLAHIPNNTAGKVLSTTVNNAAQSSYVFAIDSTHTSDIVVAAEATCSCEF